MKTIYIKTILILFIGIFLSNCTPEDGEDGTSSFGVNGTNGVNGADGVNGVDGVNGAGYDELIPYGSITIALEGTRPDDVAFTDEQEFKYTSLSSEYIADFNTVEINETSMEFSIVRFFSHPDDVHQETWAELEMTVNDPGEETESIEFSFNLSEYAVISDDLKYFILDDEYQDTDIGVSNLEITNYSFDQETNNLILSFSFDVDEDSNGSEHALSVSGEVNVIVFEEI
ncbi:hypothetical protein [Aquimarina pacifica]|uniref:hypothetical protein n=1 Tax=Aquimarina pacifica TaxID=1296415 RepID=UPI000470DEB6|nr:hypothetical protein [Aquimarina pacifica]